MTANSPKIEDEPGAEGRFRRGIENALKTPPSPHKPKPPGKVQKARATH
jgi:hypothetical protein